MRRILIVIAIVIALIGIAAFGVTQLLSKLLYGVAPHDPLILGGVALALTAVGVVASLVPASRAAAIDPLVALKE